MKNKELVFKRWQKAIFITKILSAIPFVGLVGVNGSMVFLEDLKETSDIDFLIITKGRRVYTVRFLATIVLFLLGLKRHGKHIAGRACLNRYISEKSLEIKPHNYYHAQVFSAVVPVFDKNNIYPLFQKANQWMEKKFNFKVRSSIFLIKTFNLPIKQSKFAGKIQSFLEKILGGKLGDLIERILFAIQKIEIFLKKKRDAKKGVIRVFNREEAFYYLKDNYYSFFEEAKKRHS